MPRPMLLLALCLALPAAAQTPETPGPAGARAAVAALVAAQQAQDWTAAFELVDPALLGEAAFAIRDARNAFGFAVADSALVADGHLYPESPQTALFAAGRRAAARLDSLAFFDNPSDAEVVGRLAAAVRSVRLISVYPESRYTPVRVDMAGDGRARVVGRLDILPGSSTPATVETTDARWTGSRWVVTFAPSDEGPVTGFVRFPITNVAEVLDAVLGDLFEELDP